MNRKILMTLTLLFTGIIVLSATHRPKDKSYLISKMEEELKNRKEIIETLSKEIKMFRKLCLNGKR